MTEKYPTNPEDRKDEMMSADGLDDPAIPIEELGIAPAYTNEPISEVPAELQPKEELSDNVVQLPKREVNDKNRPVDPSGLQESVHDPVVYLDDFKEESLERQGKNKDGVITGIPKHLKSDE